MDKNLIKDYKEMAAASTDTMESKIKAHLIENCFKYDESKFEGCMTYLVNIAKEILDGKNGEVPDDVCYRICRDYFDDEIWRKEEEEKARTRREKERKTIMKKLSKEFCKATLHKSNMCVFVPDSVKSVRDHANKLHQCLISCDYIGKMAERRCVLAFITDNNGNPIATAEILPNGKLGQFYGNELGHDLESMKPSKKATEVLMTWLNKYEKNLKKFMAEKEAA